MHINNNGNSIALGGVCSGDKRFDCYWSGRFHKALGFPVSPVNGEFADAVSFYCKWTDGENHDMLTRYTDGLKLGVGWAGSTTHQTTLDLRSQTTHIRGNVIAKKNLTVSGDINTNDKTSAYDGKQGVNINNHGRVYLVGGKDKTPGVIFAYNGATEATAYLIETSSGAIKIGGKLKGTVDTGSDERIKKDFGTLDRFEKFYNQLSPCCYKMKSNDEKYHIGFIAQQVESSLINSATVIIIIKIELTALSHRSV
jgi:hypothetical protein